MQSIEGKLKKSNELSGYTVLYFAWEQINGTTGIVGDCGALSVTASVNIAVENQDTQFCAFSAEVNFTDASVDSFKYYSEKIEMLSCF